MTAPLTTENAMTKDGDNGNYKNIFLSTPLAVGARPSQDSLEQASMMPHSTKDATATALPLMKTQSSKNTSRISLLIK